MPESRPGDSSRVRYAPLLSWVRFGPGSILILCFIALLTAVLYLLAHAYLAVISGAAGLVLFGVKSMEIIQVSRPEERDLIGQRCLVVKNVEKGKTGVVRVYDRRGRLGQELWSAEGKSTIPEGAEAEVEAVRSIVLLIKPKEG